MNNSESAQKGFKTFILTLSVSLIVFSVVYYFLSNYPANKSSNSPQAVATTSTTASVEGAKDERTDQADTSTSVFGAIVNKKPQGKAQVLSGATQASQSTTAVPTTGIAGITIGLALSFGLFLAAIIFTSMNPRKMALRSFEKEVLKKSK